MQTTRYLLILAPKVHMGFEPISKVGLGLILLHHLLPWCACFIIYQAETNLCGCWNRWAFEPLGCCWMLFNGAFNNLFLTKKHLVYLEVRSFFLPFLVFYVYVSKCVLPWNSILLNRLSDIRVFVRHYFVTHFLFSSHGSIL